MADNLSKRPRKGILKNSSSFDTQDTHPNSKKSKETKWDEMNIIATLHPPDKDYGHMKIEEPKTPYNYVDSDNLDVIDATELAEKIRLGAEQLPRAMQEEESEEEEEDLTPEEIERRREFEYKRKKHYNEYYAVKLARKLLEEEDEDEDAEEKEENRKNANDSKDSASSTEQEERDSSRDGVDL